MARDEKEVDASLRCHAAIARCEQADELLDEASELEIVGPNARTASLRTAIQHWRKRQEALISARPYLLEMTYRQIDAWRSGPGRAAYNASRRKSRKHPNADLGKMTAEGRIAHRKAQKAASAFRARKQSEGWSEQQIALALIRLQAKRHKRAMNSI